MLLGSNLGDRKDIFRKSAEMIEERIGIIQKKSSLYESEPWGFESSSGFLNQVLVVQTAMDPWEILNQIKQIESFLGRKRSHTGKYISRTIDIDILFYDKEVYQTQDLTIPHPLLQERRFTLLPLEEIAPEYVHPGFNKNIRELLEDCPDHSTVNKLEE